jgi:hypothetical protein
MRKPRPTSEAFCLGQQQEESNLQLQNLQLFILQLQKYFVF